MKWFGLTIKHKISIEDITIIITKKEIIILCDNLNTAKNYISFYSTILFFSKMKIEINSTFGLFNNFIADLVRKKTKDSFMRNLNHNNIIYLLEGDNIEAYYENKNETNNLLGLEIRLKNESELLEDKEKILINLVKEIGVQKSLIFGKNN